MSQQTINNLETGLVVRDKINDNFSELYANSAETKSLKAVYGAVGDGVTDDTTAITAADAAAGKKYSPAGTYDTTIAAVDLDGPYWSEGQIRDAANNKRGPWFSAIKAPPSSFGTHDSIETAFNGDLSKNQIAMEHRITGATTVGQPTTGYTYTPEAFPVYGYLYNSSGYNHSTSGNDGRTGVAFQRVRVFHAGQGDAACYNATAFVTGTRAGSTSFLANPAGVLFNGDISGDTAGVYLNAGEFIMRDSGFDVAAIGWVVNGVRTVSTGAKGAYWAGFRAQSQGTAAMDQAFGMAGLFKVGLEGTTATLTSDQALVSGKAGQRVYLNNASSNGFYTTTFNGDYLEYNTGLSGIQVVVAGGSRLQVVAGQVTVNGVKLQATGKVGFTALGNYANDAAAAAGGVAVNELYRNGSVVQIRVT